jgi:hypothetical protein
MLVAVVFVFVGVVIVTEGLLVHCRTIVPDIVIGVVKFDGGGT